MLRGNTDRYVLTGEQPAPHATLADAARSIDLMERYAAMAAGIAWTCGVLDQAGLLATLVSLPAQLHLQLPGGATVLGVHASPLADDGPGIEPGITDERLGHLLAGSGADVVIGGHTHAAADRVIGGIRALNPGSTGLPRTCGMTNWLLLEADGGAVTVTPERAVRRRRSRNRSPEPEPSQRGIRRLSPHRSAPDVMDTTDLYRHRNTGQIPNS